MQATGVQGLSGTGSVRMGAEFLARVVGLKNVFISTPSWLVKMMIMYEMSFNILLGQLNILHGIFKKCNRQLSVISIFFRSNHSSIFHYAGFNRICNYRYWDSRECRIDIDGMIADLEAAPEKLALFKSFKSCRSFVVLSFDAHKLCHCDR